MNAFHRQMADILRWARRNDWRPFYPSSRKLGQYNWTNRVRDPGTRKQSTLRVTADISGHVQVQQLMMTHRGWVSIGTFWSGSGTGIIDVLAAMYVIPAQFSTRHQLPYPVRRAAKEFRVLRHGPKGAGWQGQVEEASWKVATALDEALRHDEDTKMRRSP